MEFGAHTGHILPDAVLEGGAVGTFFKSLFENKFADFEELIKTNQRALGVGLKTMIFARDLEELKKVVELKPTFVSYEPPEFIGSATTSVAQERPEIISDAVEISKVKGIPFIVGAGIKSKDDIKKSLELGASGFAVARAIVTSEDPKKEIEDLAEGYK